ncbi:HlyD family secretion protein [Edaphobacter bradus]|uniref:HlyD family secretion protein n=1 Tax=Edaphobacter bradus TaxID=2259016 RepID=UPI0021DF710F|nr:HlyD family secretion protein [Edaphobacter bradus]
MLKRTVLVPILVLGIAVAFFLFIRGHWTTGESKARVQRTDDAYVKADETSLSTRISGTVRRVTIGDYQPVKSGQLLVELDDADYKAVVGEARAALAAAKAEYTANQDAKRAADASIAAAQAGIGQAQAAMAAAQAGIAASQASAAQAESEFKRQQALLAGKATTHQQFEQAEAAKLSTVAGVQGHTADLSRAEEAIVSARAALAGARQQRAALDAKDAGILAQIDAKKDAITVAEVNLSYTKIFAPTDGAVGEFRVHPGQLVGAGVQIVPLVQSGIWVEANYRETQLERVRTGDPVDIHIDALPSQTFHGHVSEISPASGSQFALLPPDNATGNYTKIVQRVPVRIDLDQGQQISQLRPGFSAVVAIHASGATTDREAEPSTGSSPR